MLLLALRVDAMSMKEMTKFASAVNGTSITLRNELAAVIKQALIKTAEFDKDWGKRTNWLKTAVWASRSWSRSPAHWSCRSRICW